MAALRLRVYSGPAYHGRHHRQSHVTIGMQTFPEELQAQNFFPIVNEVGVQALSPNSLALFDPFLEVGIVHQKQKQK
jgi:hypothetical protein